MPEVDGPLAGAGRPPRRQQDAPFARRVGAFLVWWVLLMSFWVWADDSIHLSELLVGAAVAVFGALLAELAQYQAGSHIHIRIEWLAEALKLPVQVGRDLPIVFGALWRRVAKGEQPRSGFKEVPVRWGDNSPEGVTRRALLLAGTSVAPNTLALGVDAERDVMIVHHLVLPRPASGGEARLPGSGGGQRSRSRRGGSPRSRSGSGGSGSGGSGSGGSSSGSSSSGGEIGMG